MLRRAYNWILNYAEHPHAIWVLSAVSFTESSFFPIPPDFLYLAMLIADRTKAWKLATVCTLSSVLGGILGYYIGYGLYETVGKMIIETYGLTNTFAGFKEGFDKWGFWIVAAKGLTPIPYKIVTIASGIANMNLGNFILASIIARGMRFFAIGAIIYFCGPGLRDYIQKNIEWLSTVTLGAIIIGFLIVIYFEEIKIFCCQLFT
jgi:membrane protein YqaA with SNARE-associated domain